MGILVGALALAIAAWWWLRRAGEPEVRAARAAETAASRRPAEDPVSPPPSPQVSADDDPVGTLRLSGKVVDPAGAPVVGATVVIGSVPARSTQTDAEGGFAFAGLARRRYALFARAGEQVGGPFELHPNEGATLTIGSGATAEIEVVDAGGAPPPPGTVVQVRADTDLRGGAMLELPAEAGRVRVVGLLPARVEIIAAAPGREASIEPLAVARHAAAPLALTLTLQPAAKPVLSGARSAARSEGVVPPPAPREPADPTVQLSGKVVAAGGGPAAWSVVRVMAASAQQRQGVRDVLSDEQGRFTIAGLPPAGLLVMARSELASSEVLTVDLAGPGPHQLTVPLGIAGIIAGRVTGADGAPVTRAEVTAQPTLWGDLGTAAELFGEPVAYSGGDGEFTLTGLPTGIWKLTAQVPGEAAPPALGRAVTGDRFVHLMLHSR